MNNVQSKAWGIMPIMDTLRILSVLKYNLHSIHPSRLYTVVINGVNREVKTAITLFGKMSIIEN